MDATITGPEQRFKEGDICITTRAELERNRGVKVKLLKEFCGFDGTRHWKCEAVDGHIFQGFEGWNVNGIKTIQDPHNSDFESKFLGIEEDKLDAVCGACDGSGFVTRDPDIGTDQECGSCGGSGVISTP